MRSLAAALALVAGLAYGECDSLVLAGLALHGDRSHALNAFTKGAGCQWQKDTRRAEVLLFENSNRNASLCAGVSWLPLEALGVKLGASLGLCSGYGPHLLPAGGLAAAREMGRGVELQFLEIPRVYGMKGDVKWFRLALSRWEPLK